MASTNEEYLALLRTQRDAVLTALSAFDLSPNAQGSGHTIDRVGFRRQLMDELKQIDELISDYQSRVPWEVLS